MARGHECYHCKQWVEAGEAHDCWTTTESALTGDLSEDLQEAYARLRETAEEFGEQRIYASHSSIMFSRKACYFFVRPKRSFLEVCFFVSRTIRSPQIRKATPSSRLKVAHIVQVRHRDEVEPPFTDWLREAYALEDQPRPPAIPRAKNTSKAGARVAGAKKKGKKKKAKPARRNSGR